MGGPRKHRRSRAVAIPTTVFLAGSTTVLRAEEAAVAAVDPNTWYTPVNGNGVKAMDDANLARQNGADDGTDDGGTTNGTHIILWACSNHTNRQWR